MKKVFCIIISVFILSSVFAEDGSKEDSFTNEIQVDKSTKSFFLGLSFDAGYQAFVFIYPTYSIGYVRKQEKKETSIFLVGNYTDFTKFGYLVFEKIFHKKNSPFFYGYQIGCGYLKMESNSIDAGGSIVEGNGFESLYPFVSSKFGYRIKICASRYLQISTEVIGFRFPINIITITVK